MQDGYMTVKEVAEVFGVHPDTVRRRIEKGELFAERRRGPYGMQYFIPRTEVDRALQITDVVEIERKLTANELKETVTQTNTELMQAYAAVHKDLMHAMQTDLMQYMQQERERYTQAFEEVRRELVATNEATVKQLEAQNAQLIERIGTLEAELKDQREQAQHAQEWATVKLEQIEQEVKRPWWRRILG